MRTGAFEFASLIEARIEALSLSQYHLRPRPVKRLIEELYPLSRLALALKQPGLDVDVSAHEDSGPIDGHIWLTGYLIRDFAVEVTFAGYEKEDALRSELLVQQGFVPGAGSIKRDKITKQIHASMEAEDYYAPIERLGESVCERSRAKSKKQYPQDTILMIAFEDMRLRGYGWWQTLYNSISDAGGIEQGKFSQIYLFNGCSNELNQVR